MFSRAKRALISSGLYKPARAAYDAFRPEARRHAREYRQLLSSFLSPGDLAFDVGANIGIRSQIMLSLGARVVAFEPQAACAAEVRARGNARLTVVEAAVGAKETIAQLHLKRASVQASLLSEWQGGPNVGAINVPVTTLDISIERFGLPAFCKIDVEGFEAEVLAGLSRPIPAMSVEYHCSEAGIRRLASIFERLQSLGRYEANLIGGENNQLLHSEWIPAEAFMKKFPASTIGHFWGDCFVRLAA